jgi:hypothetical protein
MAPRDFSPKLTAEAGRAITEAFDAMSTSSAEMAASSDRVIAKLGRVAQELGWPDSVVSGISGPMRNATKMQTEMLQRVMDACEAQVNSPNPMARVPSEMMAHMRSWPDLFSSGGWPSNQAFSELASNPVQFWMHLGEQWQKNWVQMMAPWVDSGSSANSFRRIDH